MYRHNPIFIIWQLFVHGHCVTILVTALTTCFNLGNDLFIFNSIENHLSLAIADDAVRQEISHMLYSTGGQALLRGPFHGFQP